MITVVTVTYNCRDSVEETMLSVISQDYSDLEYIIIDGASTDGTLEVIERYRSQISILISEIDRGIYDAMNKALRLAHGEWIIFMNAGDCFCDKNVLSKMDFSAVRNENVCAVYGDFIFCGKKGKQHVICNNPFYEKKDLIKSPSMGFHHQSVFVRTKLAQQFAFNTTYKLCADYDMIYRMYKAGYLFVYRNVCVAVVEGRVGASANGPILQLKEHYKLLGVEDKMEVKMRLFVFILRNKLSMKIKQFLRCK